MTLYIIETLFNYMYIYNVSIFLLHVIHYCIVYTHTYLMFYIIYIKYMLLLLRSNCL